MSDDWPIATPASLGFEPLQLEAIESAFRGDGCASSTAW